MRNKSVVVYDVQATSLNCSHAFCALCIRQWLAVKRECPNCRTAVASQMRSIVLDNYIDRMVAQLSEEMKERRAQLVVERQGQGYTLMIGAHYILVMSRSQL